MGASFLISLQRAVWRWSVPPGGARGGRKRSSYNRIVGAAVLKKRLPLHKCGDDFGLRSIPPARNCCALRCRPAYRRCWVADHTPSGCTSATRKRRARAIDIPRASEYPAVRPRVIAVAQPVAMPLNGGNRLRDAFLDKRAVQADTGIFFDQHGHRQSHRRCSHRPSM